MESTRTVECRYVRKICRYDREKLLRYGSVVFGPYENKRERNRALLICLQYLNKGYVLPVFLELLESFVNEVVGRMTDTDSMDEHGLVTRLMIELPYDLRGRIDYKEYGNRYDRGRFNYSMLLLTAYIRRRALGFGRKF